MFASLVIQLLIVFDRIDPNGMQAKAWKKYEGEKNRQ